MTIINLGSENLTKIDAVFEVLKEHDFLSPFDLHPKNSYPLAAENGLQGFY